MACLTQVATRPVAGATQRLSDRRETPLWRGPTGLLREPAGARAGRTFATREPAAEACAFYGSDGCYWNAEW